MPLNLITDAWIPVRMMSGETRLIRPAEVADRAIAAPDWDRADLNLACLEFLIGMTFLADAPGDLDDWEDRADPDPARLAARLAPLAPAFDLLGDGPRFLQDLDPLSDCEVKPTATLFIDAPGEQTIKHNKDIFVSRTAHGPLDAAQAAMALFLLQGHSPGAGVGTRVGLRGGGPLVTLVDPGTGLWDLIWANIPYGRAMTAQDLDRLPWMRPTRVSDKGSPTLVTALDNTDGIVPEVLFSMPRRIRLLESDGRITGLHQKNYGTNYTGYPHPFTPRYASKASDGGVEMLARHPNAPRFGYENWIGIAIPAEDDAPAGGEMAACVRLQAERRPGESFGLIVAGWNMSNATAVDYVESRPVIHTLSPDAMRLLRGMIRAAGVVGSSVAKALSAAIGNTLSFDAKSAFFVRTERRLDELSSALSQGAALDIVAEAWLAEITTAALRLYDEVTLPLLHKRSVGGREKPSNKRPSGTIEAIIRGRSTLHYEINAKSKSGQDVRAKLGLGQEEPA